MKKTVALTVVLALAAVSGLAAQNFGLPVDNSGVGGGLALYGNVGFPNQDYGDGTAFGATGKIGLGPIGFTATASTWSPDDGDNVTSLGGTANLKIFGGPLIPLAVTAQIGGAYASVNGSSAYHVPAGVGIALRIPNPVVSIKPWVAPRLDYLRDTDGDNHTDFGFSAGVELNMLSGLGFQAMYDYVSAEGGAATIFAFGAHYGFRIPGL